MDGSLSILPQHTLAGGHVKGYELLTGRRPPLSRIPNDGTLVHLNWKNFSAVVEDTSETSVKPSYCFLLFA